MFKSSITKFLITSLGILMTGLFIAALILAYQAWTNYALAGRIARLTNTDKALFQALVTVRAQIPKNSTALIAKATLGCDQRRSRGGVPDGAQRPRGIEGHRHR